MTQYARTTMAAICLLLPASLAAAQSITWRKVMTRRPRLTSGSAAVLLLLTVPANAQSFETLVDLRCEMTGCAPGVPLIQATDRFVYGATSEGGPADGTIFRLDRAGVLWVLAFVRQPSSLIQAADGYFYGTSDEDRLFYRMDATGAVTIVRAFEEATASLQFQGRDGLFYFVGGASDGHVFRMDATGTLTVLASLEGSGASGPRRLIEARDGRLYGTTYYGGTWGAGTVFRVEANGSVTVLHSLRSSAASTSTAYPDLMQASDGFFYVTSFSDGHSNQGTVSRMNGAGDVTVLHSFDGSTGRHPYAAPIEASDGFLYGTTGLGGAHGLGTVYRMDRAGTVTVLHAFDGATGAVPVTSLLQADDGALYGTTASGGANDHGVVFRITLPFGVTLDFPAGGERLFTGVSTSIRWTATGSPIAFDLELSRDGGVTFQPIVECTGLPGTATSCDWTPAGPRTQRAVLRITAHDASGARATDVSGARFSILTVRPRIIVAVPQPGMRWIVGSTHTIRWAHNLGHHAQFRIELSRDGGATWEVLAAAAPSWGAGAFRWTVTGPPTARAVVRVTWTDGTVGDLSRGTLAIESVPPRREPAGQGPRRSLRGARQASTAASEARRAARPPAHRRRTSGPSARAPAPAPSAAQAR